MFCGSPTARQAKEVGPMKDINSLSHTTWNCKYHIVFSLKYRRKEFYGSNRLEKVKYWENYVDGKM